MKLCWVGRRSPVVSRRFELRATQFPQTASHAASLSLLSSHCRMLQEIILGATKTHTHVHTHGSVYRFPYCFSLLDVTYEQQQHHRPISLPTPPPPPATTPILLSIEMHIGEQARALLTIHSPSDQGQASTPPYTRLKTLFADCRESTSGKIHLNLFFSFFSLFC